MSLPQPELALQVFQLVSSEQVLPIKVVWNVHPGAWTYNSHRIPLAIAAHIGGTQRSLCWRTFPVLAACEPRSISLIVSSTGCFQSPGTSPDFHDFKYHGEWLGNYTSQFPQDSRTHLTRSHRLGYVQVPQGLSTLISYRRRDLASLVPALRAIDSRGTRGEVGSEN